MANHYNGYSWEERMAKFKEMKRRLSSHELRSPEGPCRLCLDAGGAGTGVIFEFHDEDYSREYDWSEPAAYVVCRTCHIYRIHQRFSRPQSWRVFLAHVARGGYAREMREREVQLELATYRQALERGTPPLELNARNGGRRDVKGQWFANLTLDLAAMENRKSRPRE